jgi:hypothetical protein
VMVVRVSLSATVWDATPEQISVGDRIVQVVWVWAPEARTIRLLGDRFWHVEMLVIPPDTAADAAWAALALVAAGDGVCALRAISGVAAGSSCGRWCPSWCSCRASRFLAGPVSCGPDHRGV